MAGLPRFEVPSYGMKGGPLRYPKGRAGESQYEREERLKLEMQTQLRGEYLGGRGEAGRQREEQARLAQKIKNEGWEFQYTAQQRVKMAQNEAAFQAAMINPIFSDEEKKMIERKHVQGQMGFTKVPVPPDPRKPKAPKGHEFNVPFQGDDGGTYAFTVNDKGETVINKLQPFYQSPEYQKRASQAKWETDRRDFRIKLMEMEKDKIGEKGVAAGKMPRYTEEEIGALLRQYYPSSAAPIPPAPPEPTGMELEQELQRRVDARSQVSMGVPPGAQTARPAPARPPVVRPRGLEPMVNTAKVQTYMDGMKKKYPNPKDIPTEELRKFKRAMEILKRRQ